MTKIFWSWQSDRPGKTGRHFVREALAEAIEALQADYKVQEPGRDLHLDHDRKGIPGSPDLANAILEKIRSSTVFVADVTNIGKCDEVDEEGNRKSIMNPNVAIELGYALSVVGSNGLLMVMNEEYGGRKTLPFDLSHKAGPIFYKLAANATSTEIQKEKKQLVGALKVALRECISAIKVTPPEPFAWLTAKANRPSSFIGGGEVLCRPRSPFGKEQVDVIWNDGPQMFLRVIPAVPCQPAIKVADLKQWVDAGGLKPFPNHPQRFSAVNKWGVIVVNEKGGEQQDNAELITQVTTQGEIWGIDGFSLRDRQIILSCWENYFTAALDQYLTFYVNYLRLEAPLTLKAGMTGIAGYELQIPDAPNKMSLRHFGFGSPVRCVQPEIIWEGTVSEIKEPAIKMLLPFIEKVWDECGERRPDWLPKQ